MKNLRHVLRPTQWFGSSKRRQRHQGNPSKQRRLRSETLEKRELLAGDLLRPDVNPHHNGLGGVDANEDGWVTPGDVLVVLNALAEQQSLGGAAAGESDSQIEFKVDVNNDLSLTPADALMVINDLNENGPHAMDPIVEFTLDARDLDDNLIMPDANGNVVVAVNQIFQLEIGYNDLRGLGAAGVFTQFLNLQTGAGDGGILTPAMTEFQELAFPQSLNDSGVTGDYVFSIEGSSQIYTVSRSALAGNPEGEVGNALNAFGYDNSEFDVKLVLPTSNTAPFRFQISYTDFTNPDFLNVNLPNIMVLDQTTSGDNVTTFTVSPVNADGSINGDAVPFNIDFRNRFFNNQDVYGFNPEGDFNDTDGYIAVGATLEGASLSVPEKINRSLPTDQPMEAYSLNVFLDTSVTVANPVDVAIEIPDQTTEKDEYLLVFRQTGRVDPSLVTLDEDSMVSIVTTGVVINVPPVAGPALTIARNEDDATATLDLTTGTTDANGDTLTVVAASITTTGDTAGTSVSGNILSINPAAYAALTEGQTSIITYAYDISDGNGGIAAQTATVTITGVADANTAPNPGAPVSMTFTEDDAPGIVNLLANATDADGDTLSIVGGSVTQTNSGDSSGITIDETNGRLNVTPQTYGALNTNDSEIVTYSFMITDGINAPVSSSAMVTITGITDVANNNDPVVSGPVLATFGEDDPNGTVNLLMGASDPDTGDVLSVSGTSFAVVSGNAAGVALAGNSLNVTPSAYNSLSATATENVVATYSIIDGNGGSVGQTVTVTINGANDAPVVSGPISQSFDESDASTSISLLTGASDVDTGDVLNVVAGAQVTGTALGVTVSGNTLNINPGANAALNSGDTATATVTYMISDGNGGTVNQTATITINGEGTTGGNNDPVVSSAITRTFDENAANPQTIDLLQFATDADGDTLTAQAGSFTGDTSGASVSGNTLSINPSAYAALNTGDTSRIVYSYTISDGNGGSVAQTATIDITGVSAANNPPTVNAPITRTFGEDDPNGSVNLLLGAADVDGDTLMALAGSFTGNTAGITVNGNSLSVTPSAYGALNAGQTAVITYSYSIGDGNGGTVPQTATITIEGADEVVGQGSTIGGQLFGDLVENIEAVLNGATPERNGIRTANEPAMAGITVRLTTSTGATRSTITDLNGKYQFQNVPAGAYTISFDLPSAVRVNGPTSFTGSIPSSGGVSIQAPLLDIVGVDGAVSNLDILASTYLNSNGDMSAASNGGLQGGSALLNAQGNQELYIAGLGFDGVKFAEIVLNENRDAALLTILEDDGDILSVRLTEDQFVVNDDGNNGVAVQFFGGKEDFNFFDPTDSSPSAEFEAFRNAIDQVLSQGAPQS